MNFSNVIASLALIISALQFFFGSPIYMDYYADPKVTVHQSSKVIDSVKQDLFVIQNKGNGKVNNFDFQIGLLASSQVFLLNGDADIKINRAPLTVEGYAVEQAERATIQVPALFEDQILSVVVTTELSRMEQLLESTRGIQYKAIPGVMRAKHDEGYAELDVTYYSYNKSP
ncbi:hypothetical protein ACWLZS_004618 [Vibrio parahaemolyticus]